MTSAKEVLKLLFALLLLEPFTLLNVQASPSASPTEVPTAPTDFPTSSPFPQPTILPTNAPTEKPTTSKPTPNPTGDPTVSPTPLPTAPPTKNPTNEPTDSPSPLPTKQPTGYPTSFPTESPTPKPTRRPTTGDPTAYPTAFPTDSPTDAPTKEPSKSPTRTPTKSPVTPSPSPSPTFFPSVSPTTSSPSISPTLVPSDSPVVPPPPANGGMIGTVLALSTVALGAGGYVAYRRRRNEDIFVEGGFASRLRDQFGRLSLARTSVVRKPLEDSHTSYSAEIEDILKPSKSYISRMNTSTDLEGEEDNEESFLPQGTKLKEPEDLQALEAMIAPSTDYKKKKAKAKDVEQSLVKFDEYIPKKKRKPKQEKDPFAAVEALNPKYAKPTTRPTSSYVKSKERENVKSIFRPSSAFLSKFKKDSKGSDKPKPRRPWEDFKDIDGQI